MQLKFFITLFLVSVNGLAFSQQNTATIPPLIVNSNAFSKLQDQVFASYLSLDSLSSEKIDDKGVVFFKFNLENGKIKNLKYTRSAPRFLTVAIETYLLAIDSVFINVKNMDKNEVFILPIEYDYRSATHATTFGTLLKKLPNQNNDGEKIDFEHFNSLFELVGEKMYGLKCIILTPLAVNKPIP